MRGVFFSFLLERTSIRCFHLQDEVGAKQRTCRWRRFDQKVPRRFIPSCAPRKPGCVCLFQVRCYAEGVWLWKTSCCDADTMLQSYCMTWHFLVLSCFSIQSFFLFCGCGWTNIECTHRYIYIYTDAYTHVLLIKNCEKRHATNVKETAINLADRRRGHRTSTPYRPEVANGSYCNLDVSGHLVV